MTVDSNELQKLLDEKSYKKDYLQQYERIFGRTFVSTGGKETTEVFLKKLELKKGDYVLDVGCGIGGSAFLMDMDYGVRVRGVDLSKNMIETAHLRREEVGSKNTTFHLEDVTKADYPEGEFDMIYTRDAFIHIQDKSSLISKFFKWLKPGGSVFLTDYSCRGENHTPEFEKYVRESNYHLSSPQQYKKIFEQAGFADVKVTNLKDTFLADLRRERELLIGMKDEFIKDFGQEDYDETVEGWTEKIERVQEGSQMWICVYARKDE